jgi:hypothetical protein
LTGAITGVESTASATPPPYSRRASTVLLAPVAVLVKLSKPQNTGRTWSFEGVWSNHAFESREFDLAHACLLDFCHA